VEAGSLCKIQCYLESILNGKFSTTGNTKDFGTCKLQTHDIRDDFEISCTREYIFKLLYTFMFFLAQNLRITKLEEIAVIINILLRLLCAKDLLIINWEHRRIEKICIQLSRKKVSFILFLSLFLYIYIYIYTYISCAEYKSVISR